LPFLKEIANFWIPNNKLRKATVSLTTV